MTLNSGDGSIAARRRCPGLPGVLASSSTCASRRGGHRPPPGGLCQPLPQTRLTLATVRLSYPRARHRPGDIPLCRPTEGPLSLERLTSARPLAAPAGAGGLARHRRGYGGTWKADRLSRAFS
jgi:hypothetical protein